MDDALLVGVVDGGADIAEEGEAVFGAQPGSSQNSVIGMPLTSSMAKKGRPAAVAPASRTLAMFGWSIMASGLALGLEAGEDLPGVHPGLDDLEGDHARDGLALLGHPDAAEAALADLLAQRVGADHVALGLGVGLVEVLRPERITLGIREKRVSLVGVRQQALHLQAQLGVVSTGVPEKSCPFLPLQRMGTDKQVFGFRFHSHLSRTRVLRPG